MCSSDQILATLLAARDLYQVNPPALYGVQCIHSFFGYTSLIGIGETYTDVFDVAATNLTTGLPITAVPGTGSVWCVDMTMYSIAAGVFTESADAVRKVADLPGAICLNGVTGFGQNCKVLHVAASEWHVNIEARNATVGGSISRIDVEAAGY